MKNFNESNFIRNMGVGTAVLALTLVFSLMFLMPKAHAQKKYFNSYYISLNAGGTQMGLASGDKYSYTNNSSGTLINSSGTLDNSSGTLNLSFGKNFNINKFVIGGAITLGITGKDSWSGSWDISGLNKYNVKVALTSDYVIAALKAGYAFKNIMPFVKLGYIGYDYNYKVTATATTATNYSGNFSSTVSEGGFLYGAGIEYMFNHRWGMTAQYFATSLTDDIKTGTYTIGVDYNF